LKNGISGPLATTRNARDRASSSVSFVGIADERKEIIMRITSLFIVLLTATAGTALGQEETMQEIKHGAKKAGETIKNGLETAGEKTKDAAETVGEKTKETAETVGKKTKETAETVDEKTKESAETAGRKSKGTLKKVKAEASENRSAEQERATPSPNDL
jgi:hypothetical protein